MRRRLLGAALFLGAPLGAIATFAKLVVIPDSGHAPMIEIPAAFLAAVRPFL
ncbi:MAG: hypothetical protein ABI781_04060 [Burkholderiales bacterium]